MFIIGGEKLKYLLVKEAKYQTLRSDSWSRASLELIGRMNIAWFLFYDENQFLFSLFLNLSSCGN